MDRNSNDFSIFGSSVERLTGKHEFREVYNLNTPVPNVNTLGTVAIIDMANFLFQYSGNFDQKQGNAQEFFLYGEIFARQQAIINCLHLYRELHIVIRVINNNFLEIGSRLQYLCPKQMIIIHRVAPEGKIDRGKEKEVDDVACLHIRECFLKKSIIPVIVSNDQYRSFSSNIANSYKLHYTSFEFTSKGLVSLSLDALTQLFESVSPNLYVLDPDTCEINVCPIFPRNEKKSDWINMKIWHRALSESNDVEMPIDESTTLDTPLTEDVEMAPPYFFPH